MREKIINMIEQIYDPEIPVNIHDLGLIYDIDISVDRVVVKMTLTSRHCPAAQSVIGCIKIEDELCFEK